MVVKSSDKSETSYRTILEHVGVAIAVLENDMTISFVNLEFLKLFECTQKAVEGKKWAEVVSGKSMEVIRRLHELGPGTPPVEYEIPWTTLHGQSKQILAIISNIPETAGYVASFFDVTGKIYASEALWESEERFRAIFNGAAVGMTLVDTQEGRILVSNPAMQKMLGYTAKELSRMQFTNFTHPDDMENQWTLYKEMVTGNLERFEIKKRYIRKDGKVIWARLVANLALRTSGKPAVVISMVEEIP